MRASNSFRHWITAALMLLAILPWTPLHGIDVISRNVTTSTNSSGASDSDAPLLSGGGRYVFFLSSASDLLPGPATAQGALNLWRRDRWTGTTVLVSAATNGGPANASCTSIAVSTNGQVAAFISAAGNLSTSASNGPAQVFVRDFQAGTLELITIGTNQLAGDAPALDTGLSADGLTVAFASQAGNLVEGDTNGAFDVFVRARGQGTTRLVSVAASGAGSGSAASYHASLSADGRWVAFESLATNLTANDLNNREDVYLRNLAAESTLLLSADTNGFAAGRSVNPRVNRDGSRVVFESGSGALVPGDDNTWNDVFIWDKGLGLRSPTLAAAYHVPGSYPFGPTISPDGAVVAFLSGSPSLGYQLHAWDSARGSNVVVSVANDGVTPTAGVVLRPVLSDDGRHVFFLSTATNLVDGIAGGAAQVYRRDLATDTTRLVSATITGSPVAYDCTSIDAAGGSVVAFATSDGHLVANDHNNASDVFVRDLETGACELISSVAPDAASATPYGPSGLGSRTVLSGDTRHVVFTAAAPLLAADTNRVADVYVRDLEAGTVVLVSANASGAGGNGCSWAGAISRDGRYVAFLSRATDLGGEPTNAVDRVFLRDLVSGQTTLVSKTTNGAAASQGCRAPSISSDGRFVVFESIAADLAPADGNGAMDVFVFDRLTQSNTLVSRNHLGTAAAASGAGSPVLAQDDHSVFFLSSSQDLVQGLPYGTHLYVHDVVSGATRLIDSDAAPGRELWWVGLDAVSHDASRVVVTRWPLFGLGTVSVLDRTTGTPIVVASSNADNAVLSADGRWVAYHRSGGVRQLMVCAVSAPAAALASVAADGSGEGDAASSNPLLSADGRWLIFTSLAANLVAGDSNGKADVFARDLVLGRTFLLSANATGGAGAGVSGKPILGPDGRTILFESFAPDLATGDRNDARDVFLVRLSAPDSDADDMDDDWEVVYFGNLSRDGTGDADGDGMSDLAEFKAGTQPSQGAEVLRVIRVTGMGTGVTTLSWAAVPGKTYAVQYKDSFADSAWTTLSGSVPATGSTASKTDANLPPGGTRFYRAVALVP